MNKNWRWKVNMPTFQRQFLYPQWSFWPLKCLTFNQILYYRLISTAERSHLHHWDLCRKKYEKLAEEARWYPRWCPPSLFFFRGIHFLTMFFSTQAPVFTLSTCCKISISFIEVLEWVFYCNRHVSFYLCYIMKTNVVQYLKIFISWFSSYSMYMSKNL